MILSSSSLLGEAIMHDDDDDGYEDSSSSYIGSTPAFVYILSSFIANAGVSVTGFGMALIFVFVFTLFDVCGGMVDCQPLTLCDMKYAVFIQSLSLVGSMPFLIYKSSNLSHHGEEEENVRHRSQTRKRLLLCTLIPVTLVSTPAGQMCQDYVASSWIRMVVGVVVTIVVGFEIYKLFRQSHTLSSTTSSTAGQTENKVSNDESKDTLPTERSSLLITKESTESEMEGIPTSDNNKQDDDDDNLLSGFSKRSIIIWGIVLGFFSGFLGGLIGMRGPPLMIFFLHFPFPKQEARAVGAIMLFINMALRILYYLLQDYYNDHTDHDSDISTTRWFYWDTSWHLYAGVVIAGILGVPIGDWIHHHIDQSKFRLSLAILLAASGVVNIVKATSELRQQ